MVTTDFQIFPMGYWRIISQAGLTIDVQNIASTSIYSWTCMAEGKLADEALMSIVANLLYREYFVP